MPDPSKPGKRGSPPPLLEPDNDLFEKMAYICHRPPFGWYCSLAYAHKGPCLTHPYWWNLLGQWRSR